MPSGDREELLISLKRAQAEHRHLPREVMVEISQSLDIPLGEVFGVASFYSFLSTEPRGRNAIMICGSVPCYLKAEAVADEIGIGVGGTTEDGRFTFESTNCIGACDAAPAMLVNADVYGDLAPRKISQILKSYR
jgi:NADH-quinone oxidoreductase subunit E/NADP-reducing hydrogenase subunit HndA